MKVFIDCGGHFGEGFAHFHEHLKIDPSWKVIMFEPNRVAAERLRTRHLPWWKENENIHVELREEIAWSSNGSRKFLATKWGQWEGPNCGVGSTAMARENWTDPYAAEEYDVPTCDLSEIILSFPSEYKIFLKLDVEGSEVEILERLIQTDAIDRVRHTWVEWHSRMFKDPRNYNARKKGIQAELKRRGSNCWDWK